MARTDRDKLLLKVLARKIRVVVADQVATWWAVTPATARRRLNHLAEIGCLEAIRGDRALPFIELAQPVVTWSPGRPDPNPDAVAWRLQHRWPDMPPVPVTVYRASQHSNNRYGGPRKPKPIREGQLTHDLHVTSLYVRFSRCDAERAQAWLGEDCIPKAGYRKKDPDAVLIFDNGRPELIIEFGGKYDARRVADFHRDCRERERAYELW